MAVILISTLTLASCGVIKHQYKLTIGIIGKGKVAPENNLVYERETIVEVEAIPLEGWEFYRWEGPVNDRLQRKTELLVDKQHKIKAIFKKISDPEIKIAPGGMISLRNGTPVKPRPGGLEDIQFIMLHAISDAAINPKNPYELERIATIFREYGVDSHYVIDRKGNIHQFIDDDNIAHHAGLGSWGDNYELRNNMNQYAIGIEIMGIGTKEEMLPVLGVNANNKIRAKDRGYTEEQYRSLNILLNHLIQKYTIAYKNIITHKDYDHERKWDPGFLFDWNKVYLP